MGDRSIWIHCTHSDFGFGRWTTLNLKKLTTCSCLAAKLWRTGVEQPVFDWLSVHLQYRQRCNDVWFLGSFKPRGYVQYSVTNLIVCQSQGVRSHQIQVNPGVNLKKNWMDLFLWRWWYSSFRCVYMDQITVIVAFFLCMLFQMLEWKCLNYEQPLLIRLQIFVFDLSRWKS